MIREKLQREYAADAKRRAAVLGTGRQGEPVRYDSPVKLAQSLVKKAG
jgi:hypothetical protein